MENIPSGSRRSIRLQDYDYSQNGAYFVTICTKNKKCLLGKVENGLMLMNECGQFVLEAWQDLPKRFMHVTLDYFVVMPNHIHGILHISPVWTTVKNATHSCMGAIHCAHSNHKGVMNHAPTLGELVRTLKATSTRQIHLAGHDDFAWHRNYYEHVIRNENSLNCIREYIENNPQQLEFDHENPAYSAPHP